MRIVMRKFGTLSNVTGCTDIADSLDSYAFDLPDAHVLVERLNPEGTDRLVSLKYLENPVKIILLDINNPHLYAELEETIASLNLHVTKHQDATTSIDLAPRGCA